MSQLRRRSLMAGASTLKGAIIIERPATITATGEVQQLLNLHDPIVRPAVTVVVRTAIARPLERPERPRSDVAILDMARTSIGTTMGSAASDLDRFFSDWCRSAAGGARQYRFSGAARFSERNEVAPGKVQQQAIASSCDVCLHSRLRH